MKGGDDSVEQTIDKEEENPIEQTTDSTGSYDIDHELEKIRADVNNNSPDSSTTDDSPDPSTTDERSSSVRRMSVSITENEFRDSHFEGLCKTLSSDNPDDLPTNIDFEIIENTPKAESLIIKEFNNVIEKPENHLISLPPDSVTTLLKNLSESNNFAGYESFIIAEFLHIQTNIDISKKLRQEYSTELLGQIFGYQIFDDTVGDENADDSFRDTILVSGLVFAVFAVITFFTGLFFLDMGITIVGLNLFDFTARVGGILLVFTTMCGIIAELYN